MVVDARVTRLARYSFVFDYFLSHLGYFAVMPILALWLPDKVSPFIAGCAMAAFGISVRASTLVMGRLLRLLPFAAAMQIGLVAASVFSLLSDCSLMWRYSSLPCSWLEQE
ncbi:hypothetical protein ACL1IA_02030 [Corynebacterium striatum]|uniref:hypothetical protein n=1 Tax=Corynebacterium striatum TaxID=43770 RepID=UPI001A2D030D|nr:hypothetical protein [Corynebacterium striatum]